jgi:hypothetical protein
MEVTDLTVDNKKLWFLDNVFPKDQLNRLNRFCYTRPFFYGQTGSLNGEDSTRASSHLQFGELISSGCMWYVRQAVEKVGLNLVCNGSYVNTYQIMTPTAKHCDYDSPNFYTIIIFANSYWHDDWGGELTFYGMNKINYTLDFVPGRIVIADARIEHRVNPLTTFSKDFRFTVAIKCLTQEEAIKRNMLLENCIAINSIKLL